MDNFFLLKFAGQSSRFDDACELQNDAKKITAPPAMRDGAALNSYGRAALLRRPNFGTRGSASLPELFLLR
jgi:hypothetical protein